MMMMMMNPRSPEKWPLQQSERTFSGLAENLPYCLYSGDYYNLDRVSDKSSSKEELLGINGAMVRDFYWPDAIPVTQPTVSQHRRKAGRPEIVKKIRRGGLFIYSRFFSPVGVSVASCLLCASVLPELFCFSIVQS